jgi:hypothetical protein
LTTSVAAKSTAPRLPKMADLIRNTEP